MKFFSPKWDAMMERLRGNELLAGENARLSRTAQGVIVSADAQAGRWSHPWKVSVVWNEKRGWLARVKAGFVNGEEPTLNGKPLLELDEGDGLSLPLGEIEAAPPAFFAAMGVRKPMDNISIDTGAMTMQIVDNSWENEFKPAPRRLFFCDIQITKARIGLIGDVQIVAGEGMGGNVAVYSPRSSSIKIDALGPRPLLIAVSRFAPPQPPSLVERMMGVWDDPQEDILHVARVWMLSPPGNTDGEPDKSWAPFVQHFVFWNLAHASRVPKIASVLRPITLVTGLAGGVGDRVNAAMLAPMNDRAQQINAALNSVSPEGKFWTV